MANVRNALDAFGEPLPVPRGFRHATFAGAEYFLRLGYRIEACDGAAHSNAHIDNCMRCAPMWGVVAVKIAA